MTATVAATGTDAHSGKLFGHPTGLFTLFFAEMWERFSYYGMRALLIFYMTKDFLRYGDNEAYAVYGAYTSLVYMTPYFGGMIADRFLGQRRAVVLGGFLMAAGHLLMTARNKTAFFAALALLICGNGFFKPNISTIVGSLYPPSETARKDGGFTIFYIGINLGAAMSPILCGYVGETYGWHYGFGLATIGMLVGIAVFVAPTRLTQLLIGLGALVAAVGMPFLQDSWVQLVVRILLAAALLVAGVVAVTALGRGGLPEGAGRPADPELHKRKLFGVVRTDLAIYVGALLAVVAFTFIVESKPLAKGILYVTGGIAVAYILYEAIVKSNIVERHRLFVVLILMFFSLLFWAFFEQAGSSINNFTDRNVDRVTSGKVVAQGDVGTTVTFRVLPNADEAAAKYPLLGQAQLGYQNGNEAAKTRTYELLKSDGEKGLEDKAKELKGTDNEDYQKAVKAHEETLKKVSEEPTFTMTSLTALRTAAGKEKAPDETKTIEWTVVEGNVGMRLSDSEIPASEFQAANPIFILIFGLVLSAIWTFLAVRKIEPSTTVKFALGLLQLGLGFGVLWYGAKHADARGMTAMLWLLLAYLLHTTGELCISPVGLSMITKLSPARMVSTLMGAWFLATAFSQYLAGIIAQLTGVSGEEGDGFIPPPIKSVDIYGTVFGQIAIIACGSAVLCFALSPLLSKWMHPEVPQTEPTKGGGGH